MPNRLAQQSSPYLLQHAHNPVDWWPWGPEAIAEARRRDVPIFVSVGYSTCYWCHVMERESFEDDATARVMNERFVNIKVDREERPDLDDLYMAAVQMLTGSGGWPMSLFLEPKTLKPFWGGTYFPPRPAHGRPSFTQVLMNISGEFARNRSEIDKQAGAVAEAVGKHLGEAPAPVVVGLVQISGAAETLLTIHDRAAGGFGRAPKFPQPVYLEYLLLAREYVQNEGQAAIDAALRLTLDKMATGGMFDQVGGGFHRYSTDAIWLVPHFEKMLYDQGQLLSVYAKAAKVYGDSFYAQIARRIAVYVQREMTSPGGAFYTAQDAEVDGREGLNYVWTPAQVKAALPEAEWDWYGRVYGMDQGANFQDPHHPDEPATNVLRLDARPEIVAERMNLSPDAFLTRIERLNEVLLTERSTRTHPRLDDKVVTSWNGLMILGLATAAMELNEPDGAMARLASDAATAMLKSRAAAAGLLRSQRSGQGSTPAVLEDYAALIGGLIAMHRLDHAAQKTQRAAEWLKAALDLMSEATARFGDAARGGFFDTPAETTDLFVRTRMTYDGAMPSAGSMMLHNLIDLHQITGDGAHLYAAHRCLTVVSAAMTDSPVATINSVRALLRLVAFEAAEVTTAQMALGAKLPPNQKITQRSEAVDILASTEEVTISADEPGEMEIKLVIAPGYHINSAFAGEQSGGVVIPLRVTITGGSGVKAYADYPAGEPLAGAAHTVHSGELIMRIALERDGEWAGAPRLSVTFQACTETECLAPATVVLGVEMAKG